MKRDANPWAVCCGGGAEIYRVISRKQQLGGGDGDGSFKPHGASETIVVTDKPSGADTAGEKKKCC